MKRRGILEWLTAIGIGSIVVGGAAPVAINRFTETSANVLSIPAGEIYALSSDERYTAVEWEGANAQLDWQADGNSLKWV